MTTWSKHQLRKIARADDLHIAPFREDGWRTAPRRGSGPSRSTTLVTCAATTGRTLEWYQAAVRQEAGRIIAAGVTKEVTSETVGGPIKSRIDDAYRAKYHRSPYLNPMIDVGVRSATITIMPRYDGLHGVWRLLQGLLQER
jgi:hypothetical protein